MNRSKQIKDVLYNGMLDAALSRMRSSLKLLLCLAAATAVFLVQPVKAARYAQGGATSTSVSVPNSVSVPDGGSTISLLGCALFGLAALRRKLSC